MRILIAVVIVLGAIAPSARARTLQDAPIARAAAVCADYPNQAAAQRAADTIDADGDGIYCESLPCPCLKPGAPTPPIPTPTATPVPAPTATPTPTPTPAPTDNADCSRPSGVQSLSFSASKYPNIRRHTLRAIRKGWPAVLVLNRAGADARRDRLLRSWDTRPGYDRDEYPPLSVAAAAAG